MYNLAVIFESSPFDMKGQFNAVHNRVKHLVATGRCKVDVWCLHSRDNTFTRKMRGTMKVPHPKTVEIEGVEYRMLWYRFSVLDHILTEKLHRKSFFFDRFIRKRTGLFKGYDMILAHSYEGAYMAKAVREGIPVKGYFHWSLMDNLEWHHGFRPRFGYLYVNYATLERTPKLSAEWMKEVIRTGRIA